MGQLADLTRATVYDLEESMRRGRLTFTVDGDVATAHPEAVMGLAQEAIVHQTEMLDD